VEIEVASLTVLLSVEVLAELQLQLQHHLLELEAQELLRVDLQRAVVVPVFQQPLKVQQLLTTQWVVAVEDGILQVEHLAVPV
jgi:hypothetical protein